MISNLYVRIDKNIAFKVLAIVEDHLANQIAEGAVIDTVDGCAIIASYESIKLSDHMWEADKTIPLQIGHELVRVLQ